MVVGEQVVCPSGRWPGWGERPDDAVAVAEADAALGVALDGVAALVHEAMVLPAEEDEVVEARLAAVRPVLAVVGLQMAAALAAGETAGVVVAGLEQPAQRRGDRAAAAADADGEAVALDLRHDVGVAAEPAGGLGRDQRAVLELGAATAIGAERGGVDVDDDTRPLAAGLVRCGHRCLGEIEQRLDPGRTRRIDRSAAAAAACACGSFAAAARSSRRRSSTRSRAASSALISRVPSSAASRARRKSVPSSSR